MSPSARASVLMSTIIAAAGCLVGLLVAPAPASEVHRLSVEVISGRPEAVSGGDALVRVALPAGVPTASVTVSVDGRDVSGVFHLAQGDLIGLVDGLAPGRHRITAAAQGTGSETARITA